MDEFEKEYPLLFKAIKEANVGAPCPYAQELFNDDTPCTCSDEERYQCAMDI